MLSTVRSLIFAARPHHWIKNSLLFVPAMAAHRILETSVFIDATLGFAAFCLCASSGYLINDVIDLDNDRRHPRKKQRPLASGSLPRSWALAAAAVLLLLAFAIARSLEFMFLAALGGYFVVSVAYSLLLKRIVVLDILVLAGLYTLRLIGGGYATELALSFWLLAFSMFLFVSLAALKRFAELVRREDGDAIPGRGYLAADHETLARVGTSSGFIAVLVLALYVNSEQVRWLYQHPKLIWLLCPLLMYWIGRIWLLAQRRLVDDDPLIFAIRDGVSWLLGVASVAVVLLAT